MKNGKSFEFKGLQIREIRFSSLSTYSELLSSSYPNFEPSTSYLEWLYVKNPRGPAIGFDAFDGAKLVAHYVCIPIKVDGYRLNSLLSLNTATHPSYQGRGLFTALANQTFEKASSNFANVIGVANSSSVKGFIKHLGFESLGNLELRFGQLDRQKEGSKIYSKEDLIWRSHCPGRPLHTLSLKSGASLISIKPHRFGPKLQSIVHDENSMADSDQRLRLGFTVDWRKEVNPRIKLPKSLKPSPLELIFKPLLEPDPRRLTSFSFPDFDAF
jgi:GNAT superfamily N-acetyltransferase